MFGHWDPNQIDQSVRVLHESLELHPYAPTLKQDLRRALNHKVQEMNEVLQLLDRSQERASHKIHQ